MVVSKPVRRVIALSPLPWGAILYRYSSVFPPGPMTKWFNTAGPCKATIHYLVPPSQRLPNLVRLIDQENYFVIHAPRQTGKTTAMLTLAQELTQQGTYAAVLLSVEVGAAFPQNPGMAEAAILADWRQTAEFWLPPDLQPPPWPPSAPGQQIGAALRLWAKACPRPLVVFIDEVDALRDETLIALLRQLRSGYALRPLGFPQSIALIGMRDVRDYKVAAGGSDRLSTASPFNIKVESLTLGNFSFAEVEELYRQHTQATGQVFTPAAIDHAFALTTGQPWLVNALARQATEVLAPDPTIAITPAIIDQAQEILINRQDTHLDSLAERLREDRVRAIIQPILAGQELPQTPADDLRYVLDLGLCSQDQRGGIQIANPIYREVIPTVLATNAIASLTFLQPTWLSPTGELWPDALLQAFLDFWRQHGQPLLKSTPYPEIAPHLVLMAFLHRVVNGGGSLEREYAIGSGRMDICLRYGQVTLAMELKVWKPGRPDPLAQGLEQLDRYLAGLGLDQGWLVVFDQRPDLPLLEERTSASGVTSPGGRRVTVIRG